MHSVAEHLIGGFPSTLISPKVKRLIQDYEIAGFILFKRNIKSPQQVKTLNEKLQSYSKKTLFLGVDHEGGNVFRMEEPFTKVPPMSQLGLQYQKTKSKKFIKEVARLLAREIQAVGFNWNYAPVVDVHSNPKNPIIGKRAFSPDPKVVTHCAEAMIAGFEKEGLLSCIKHFPGHGSTFLDSHKELPLVDANKRLLWRRDLYPYRKLIPKKIVPALMTAHIIYTKLDPENCATLSPKILTKLLRKDLAYKGLIVSDDMHMKAIADNISIPIATEQFLRAGGDIALICHEPQSQIETIKYLQKVARSDKKFQNQLKKSFKRIEKVRKRYLNHSNGTDLEIIGSKKHQKIVQGLQ